VVGDNHETSWPFVGVANLKGIQDTPPQRCPTGFVQTNQHESMMGSGLETADVGEIQVLRDEETPVLLSGLPHDNIIVATQSLLGNCVNVVTQLQQAVDQRGRQILVELDLHAT